MSKSMLVALREYMENLKTKTFWIGIMAFPVIFVLMIWVPTLFKSDVRKYTVVDNSRDGWLLKAVEDRSALPDLEKVFHYALKEYKKKSDDFEKLPEMIRVMIPMVVEKFGDDQIAKAAEQISVMFSPEVVSQVEKMGIGKEFEEQKQQIKKWWSSLPPKEAAKFGKNLAKSRYQWITVDLAETDPYAKLNKMLNTGELFAYFVVGQNPEDGSEGCKYVSKNLTDTNLLNWFSGHATKVVQAKRIETADIDKKVAEKIQEPLRFESKQVSKEGVEEEVAQQDQVRQWAPAVFVYILWISVFTITQMLLTNTIEEKSNKLMEVLLSSVSPVQLMTGKIIGIACTGLTMVCSWVFFFIAGVKLLPLILGKKLDIDLTVIISDPIFLGSFVAYFLMGFLLLSAILVGIGSVCNSLKEAQNLMTPVTIVMIVPLLAMVPIGKDPNGSIATFMSYIPPFTPFVMMNRAAGPPAAIEYVLTSILLVISIVIAFWCAAKVFRVGILMTGKPPKLMEILRWLRAPVGHVRVMKEPSEK